MAELAAGPPDEGEAFDVVVVGSGFGGAVAAHALGEAGLSVCVLERGKAYAPGDFARTPAAMKANLWSPAEGLHGLVDYWSFRGLDAVVASGLGGGSLIYANVLLRRDEDAFSREGWPVALADLEPHYAAAERMLGAVPYPADREPWASTPKTRAFRAGAQRAGYAPFHPPLAVAFGGRPGEPIGDDNLHRAPRRTCVLCAECVLGCNDGAKHTLDLTYLSAARARLHTRCEARAVVPDGEGYEVRYVVHHPHQEGRPVRLGWLRERRVKARRVVVAAGALATAKLLLRSRSALPRLGPALGTRFSGNGDLMAFARGCADVIEPARGPTITTAVRGEDLWLEEAGLPGFLTWLEQARDFPRVLWRYRTFVARYAPLKLGLNVRTDMSAALSQMFGDLGRSSRALPLLGMGRDTPSGVLRLRGERLAVEWRTKESDAHFRRVRETARAVAEGMGGRYADMLLWRLRRVATVHPLGGAPMGRTPAEGVVGPDGEAFGHPGLYVTCGAAMPGPVGPNPSLTIAAWAGHVAAGIAARA